MPVRYGLPSDPAQHPSASEQRDRSPQDPRGLVSVVASRPVSVDLSGAGLLRFAECAYLPGMAKRLKLLPQERGFVLFDVVFEDGSRASNRRVPMEILGGLDGDEPAHDLIGQQEAEIALKAGRPARAIQSLTRSPARDPKPLSA